MGEATVRRFTYAVKFFSSLFQLQNKTISSSLSTFHFCLTLNVSTRSFVPDSIDSFVHKLGFRARLSPLSFNGIVGIPLGGLQYLVAGFLRRNEGHDLANTVLRRHPHL